MSMDEYEKLALVKMHAEGIVAYCAAEMDRSTDDERPSDRIIVRAERIIKIIKSI